MGITPSAGDMVICGGIAAAVFTVDKYATICVV